MTLSSALTAPLFVVVGATGGQGGSTVRALHASSKPYRVRAITRDASKPAAQALAKEGVEVHAVNIVVGNELAVKEAFKGADYVFVSISLCYSYLRLTVSIDRL